MKISYFRLPKIEQFQLSQKVKLSYFQNFRAFLSTFSYFYNNCNFFTYITNDFKTFQNEAKIELITESAPIFFNVRKHDSDFFSFKY